MAFAQLTYRQSLRDIEVCLATQTGKLYHMGLLQPVARATLADANEARDWRIYAEFVQRLIAQARTLYVAESFGVNLTNTVYALDATTIDLCLSVFPLGAFSANKGGSQAAYFAQLVGQHPHLYPFIHIPDGKLGDVNVLDILTPETGAFYVMDHGYIDFARLHGLHQAHAIFVTLAKSNIRSPPRLFQSHQSQDSGYLRPDDCIDQHESVEGSQHIGHPLAANTQYQWC